MSVTPKVRRPPGRPKTITPELEPAIFNGIAGGLSIAEACAKAGVSYASFQRLWVSDETFRNKAARAYLHGSIFFLNNAEHRLENSTN